MPNLHPYMNILVRLDPACDAPRVRQEVKRSFAFVAGNIEFEGRATAAEAEAPGAEAPTDGLTLSERAVLAAEAVPENELVLRVAVHAPFWDASDEKAAENWPAFQSWLAGKLGKVSAALTGAARDLARDGGGPVSFSWLTLDLKEAVGVRIHLAADSSVPAEAAAAVAGVRAAMAAGELGEGVVRVSVPSRESYLDQLAGELFSQMEKEREEAEALAAAPAEEEPAGEAGGAEAGGAPDSDGAPGATSGEEAPASAGAPEGAGPSAAAGVSEFAIDYGTWGVERADGSSSQYDDPGCPGPEGDPADAPAGERPGRG